MVGTTLGGHAGRRAAVRGPRLVGAFLACAVAPTAQPASGQPGAEIAETAEVFTLGFDGDVHFQRIKSVSISDDGKIVVLDVVGESDPAVTVVSGSGEVMARWGRAGGGPGNLEARTQLRAVFVAGDTVAIAGEGRAATYTWRGEELARYRPAAPPLPESLVALGDDRVGGSVRAIAFVEGRIVTWKLGFDYARVGELAAGGGGNVDDLFSAMRSAMRYTLGPWDESETWTARDGPLALDLSLATRFFPQPVLAMIPGRRVVAGFGDEYVLPGALWVERDLGIDDEFSEPLECWKTCRSWDLFDMNDGAFLGAASLPEGFSPMAGNDSLLAGVVVDELDQSGLRVLRVSVPGMGVRGR